MESLRLGWERFWNSDEKYRLGRMRPLVSVYVPTHNRADLLLTRGLPGILNQTYRRLEVIVVAHGCTDDTARKVRGLDPRLRVLEIPKRARLPNDPRLRWFCERVEPSNAGLKECQGQWIATCDDDDTWHPCMIEKLLLSARVENLEFISAAGQTHRGPIEPYDVGGVKVGPLQTWLYRSYLKFMKFNPNCWMKSWNRVCDTDLQERFRKAGVRMGYMDEVLVDILPRPGETEVGSRALKC